MFGSIEIGVITSNYMNMTLTMIISGTPCCFIHQIDICKKAEETKKNFVILQTNDVNTKVCSKHDNIALQYLIFESVIFLWQ